MPPKNQDKRENQQLTVIEDQAQFYEQCAEAISEPQPDLKGRRIAIASLHGHGGRRTTEEPGPDTRLGRALAFFGASMTSRITARDEPWQVRQIVNITSELRLKQVIDRQLALEGPSFELRAIVDPHAIAVLSPLVIGDKHAFIALDDLRIFRARSGISLHGPDSASWALTYFEELWNAAPFKLRDHVGARPDELARISEALKILERVAASRPARQFAFQIAPNDELLESTKELIASGEGPTVEFKQSLEYLLPSEPDLEKVPEAHREAKAQESKKAIVHSALKTICGFLNGEGGSLLIGVNDAGQVVGIAGDLSMLGKKQSTDEFELKLHSLIKGRFANQPHGMVKIRFVRFEDGLVVCRVDVEHDDATEHYLDGKLYVRDGGSTEELTGPHLAAWLRRRPHR